jgi:hypothetical protein
MISHFLPFTYRSKHDSGGRARQDNYFFVAPIALLSSEKLRASGILFAHRSRNLPLCLSGNSFFRLENTLQGVVFNWT